MIQPDIILPKEISTQPKLKITKHLVISIFIGLLSFIFLIYGSFIKINNSVIIYIIISMFISIIYFSLIFSFHIKKLNYINQWNIEREYLYQEKIKLKQRAVDAKIVFIMTGIGKYGNSDFAKKNKTALRIIETPDKKTIKLSTIPLFNNKEKKDRFIEFIDYLLVVENSILYNILNSNDKELIILDNFTPFEKMVLSKKINEIKNNEIENFSFSPKKNINKSLNMIANENKSKNIFILGLNINKYIENSGEAILLIELNSASNNENVKIHQSPEIKDDDNIESVISFGNCLPNELEFIWYSNLTDLEISELIYDINKISKESNPKIINIDSIFGSLGDLSELLTIVLAIEQTSKNNAPQLVISSHNKYTARIISKNAVVN